eukprot:Sspe_Gene.38298::Locus_18459_Transcript_1_1_Confidence_1.000_Length_2020::g.38298::m.38298
MASSCDFSSYRTAYFSGCAGVWKLSHIRDSPTASIRAVSAAVSRWLTISGIALQDTSQTLMVPSLHGIHTRRTSAWATCASTNPPVPAAPPTRSKDKGSQKDTPADSWLIHTLSPTRAMESTPSNSPSSWCLQHAVATSHIFTVLSFPALHSWSPTTTPMHPTAPTWACITCFFSGWKRSTIDMLPAVSPRKMWRGPAQMEEKPSPSVERSCEAAKASLASQCTASPAASAVTKFEWQVAAIPTIAAEWFRKVAKGRNCPDSSLYCVSSPWLFPAQRNPDRGRRHVTWSTLALAYTSPAVDLARSRQGVAPTTTVVLLSTWSATDAHTNPPPCLLEGGMTWTCEAPGLSGRDGGVRGGACIVVTMDHPNSSPSPPMKYR